jgi:hypothetical protein
LPDYREKLFSMFPKLGILDNLDNQGRDIEYDEDESSINSEDVDSED